MSENKGSDHTADEDTRNYGISDTVDPSYPSLPQLQVKDHLYLLVV